MDEPEFKDFPLSYRLSQYGMIFIIAVALGSKKLGVKFWPAGAQWVAGTAVVGIFAFTLLTACYVVLRYPYLSLVNARDGDLFAKQFSSKTLLFLVKYIGIVTLFALTIGVGVSAWNHGFANLLQDALLVYLIHELGFAIYLGFFYSAERNPAVATFIRATLGIGVILAPIFIPVLMIAAIRCKALLDEEMGRQDFQG